MLEKRGRKAAQRALRELTGDHASNNLTSYDEGTAAAADTTISTTDTAASRTAAAAAGGKRRATNHHYYSGTSTTASAEPRRTPLGGVSGNGARYGGGAAAAAGGTGLGLSSSRDGAAVRRARIGEIGREEEEGDAVWLREAEALLSRGGNQDVQVGF